MRVGGGLGESEEKRENRVGGGMMRARKMKTGERVKLKDGESSLICYVYSITTNHIVLRMPNNKLWCLSLDEFDKRINE